MKSIFLLALLITLVAGQSCSSYSSCESCTGGYGCTWCDDQCQDNDMQYGSSCSSKKAAYSPEHCECLKRTDCSSCIVEDEYEYSYCTWCYDGNYCGGDTGCSDYAFTRSDCRISTDIIVGIVVGIGVLILCIAGGVFAFIYYRKKKRSRASPVEMVAPKEIEQQSSVEQELDQSDTQHNSQPPQTDARQSQGSQLEGKVSAPRETSARLSKSFPQNFQKEESFEPGEPLIIHKQQLIGRGGMGTVYKCRIEGKQGIFALKIVQVPEEGKERDLALQEVELLRTLDHPNIVPLVAIQEKIIPIKPTEDNPDEDQEREEIWMVMELFDDSLGSILKKKEEKMKKREGETERKTKGKWFREKDMLQWMIQILSGLEYLHGKKIGHRDIKSDNVLARLRGVDTVDQLCLTDFGVSRIVGEEADASTVVGTLAYKAPEVVVRTGYDPLAADMWSIGVLLCEFAVGQPIPFPQLTEEKKTEKGNYPIILEFASQCCSEKPEDRPSATQLLELCRQRL